LINFWTLFGLSSCPEDRRSLSFPLKKNGSIVAYLHMDIKIGMLRATDASCKFCKFKLRRFRPCLQTLCCSFINGWAWTAWAIRTNFACFRMASGLKIPYQNGLDGLVDLGLTRSKQFLVHCERRRLQSTPNCHLWVLGCRLAVHDVLEYVIHDFNYNFRRNWGAQGFGIDKP